MEEARRILNLNTEAVGEIQVVPAVSSSFKAGGSPGLGGTIPSGRWSKLVAPATATGVQRPWSIASPRIGSKNQEDEKASIRNAEVRSVEADDDKRDEDDEKSVQSEPASVLSHVSIDPAPGIGGKTESGWAAIAKSIRGIDEQKIKDYKEDIDTILVFAGLYSAVLSALLVESYQALQPDPSAIMITLLVQLVTQTHTYTFMNGYLNSTIPALDASAVSPPFEPSLAAKRVNVLWFASLTLSLISASFGILVKQWLREHLAGEHISPQAQLRIRHFRTPGLEHWGVFAIAALLPLILQLALALFFIGLCFFTLNVHQSIGYTTIPLVAAWAFLFITASFAPVLSPRCPYKIPIFKSVVKLLRAGLFRTIRLFKHKPPLQSRTEWTKKPNWTWWSLDYTEEKASKETCRDVDILVDVDASQTDDRLVMKMCSALKETHTEPDLMIDFALKIITIRLQTEVKRPLPLMLDLSQLPVRTCTILMDTVADVLAREVSRFSESEPIEWTDLMRDCLFLLVARLPCLLSDKAMAAVSLCFSGTQGPRLRGTLQLIFAGLQRQDRYALCLHLQKRLRNAFLHLNVWQVQFTIWTMMKMSCCTCGNCRTISDVMERHVDTIPPELIQHACDLLSSYMLHQVNLGVAWNEWHRGILLTLLKQWEQAETLPWHSALQELVRRLITKPEFAPYFCRHLFHKNEYVPSAEKIFHITFQSSTERVQILRNMHGALEVYLDEMMKMPVLLDDMFFLTLLWYVDGQMPPMIYGVEKQPHGFVEWAYLPIWQLIWKTVHDAMRLYDPALRTEKQAMWANVCLEKIDTLDELWFPSSRTRADASEDFDQWIKAFKPAKSFFDDDVIEDLMKFLPAPKDVQFKRVRRIYRKRELERAEELIRETVEEEDEDEPGVVGIGEGIGQRNSAHAAAADPAEQANNSPDGEEATFMDTRRDMPSFGDIDAGQTDVRLMMNMCSALQSMRTNSDLTIEFVLKIMAFQLQTEFERPIPLMLELSKLPVRPCTILMDAVADVLVCEARRFSESKLSELTDIMRDCLSLLVARLPCPLPDKAMAAVSLCFTVAHVPRSRAPLELMFTSVRPKDRYVLCLHLQERLRDAFLRLDPWHFTHTMSFMMGERCCSCDDCNTIEAAMEQYAEAIPQVLMQHTCDLLTVYMLDQVKAGAAWGGEHRWILLSLFKRWVGAEKVPWHTTLEELVQLLLLKPKFAPYFYRLLFHASEYHDAAEKVFCDTFSSSTKKQRILVNMYNAFTTHVVEMTKTPALLDDRFYLKMLYYIDGQMAPMMYVATNESRPVVEALYLPLWQLIWKMAHSAMRRYRLSTRTEEQIQWVNICLKKIDKLDDVWLPSMQLYEGDGFDQWVTAFNPAKSFFDDDIIEDLMKFLPTPEKTQYKRIRRFYRKRELALLSPAKKEQKMETAAADADGEAGANDTVMEDANLAVADEAELTGGPPDDMSIVPPSIYRRTARAARLLDGEMENDDFAAAFMLAYAHNIVPEPEQLLEVTHPAPLVRGDTDRTLVDEGTGQHAEVSGGAIIYHTSRRYTEP